MLSVKLETCSNDTLNEIYCHRYITLYNSMPKPEQVHKELLMTKIKSLIRLQINKEDNL